jgi:hypothetical protein
VSRLHDGTPRKGYTEDHLREAWWRYLGRKPPSETLAAAGAATAANGAGTATTGPPGETNDQTGPATDGGDASRLKETPKERSAHNGPGPARRRSRPNV